MSCAINEDEVKVTQYLRAVPKMPFIGRPQGAVPFGGPGAAVKKQVVFAKVGLRHARLAKNMIISAELLTSWFVAIYVRHKNEPQDAEVVGVATNAEGENNPISVLQKLIEKVAQRNQSRRRVLDTRNSSC